MRTYDFQGKKEFVPGGEIIALSGRSTAATPNDDPIAGFETAARLDNIAQLRAFDPAKSVAVTVLGYYAATDCEPRNYYWAQGETAADNGGSIIASSVNANGRWKLLWTGALSVRWFGAKGDGFADDTAAIQATLDWAAESGSKGVFIPKGTYLISDTLTLDNVSDFSLCGQMGGATAAGSVLLWRGTDDTKGMLDCNRVGRSMIAWLTFKADSSAYQAAYGIRSRRSSSGSTTPTQITFFKVSIQGTVSYIDKGILYAKGAGDTDSNNDLAQIIFCEIANFGTAGISFEHSQTKANAIFHTNIQGNNNGGLYCVTNALGTGADADQGGAFKMWGGTGGGVDEADFHIGKPRDLILIDGWDSEQSKRLLTMATSESGVAPIKISNTRFAMVSSRLPADGYVIKVTRPGSFVMEGCAFNGNSNCDPRILLQPPNGLQPLPFAMRNCYFHTRDTDIDAIITIAGTAGARMFLMGNQARDINNGGATINLENRLPDAQFSHGVNMLSTLEVDGTATFDGTFIANGDVHLVGVVRGRTSGQPAAIIRERGGQSVPTFELQRADSTQRFVFDHNGRLHLGGYSASVSDPVSFYVGNNGKASLISQSGAPGGESSYFRAQNRAHFGWNGVSGRMEINDGGGAQDFAIVLNNATRFQILEDGKTGFFGATPVAQPSVTGHTVAGVLRDLIDALDATTGLGLVSDGVTALATTPFYRMKAYTASIASATDIDGSYFGTGSNKPGGATTERSFTHFASGPGGGLFLNLHTATFVFWGRMKLKDTSGQNRSLTFNVWHADDSLGLYMEDPDAGPGTVSASGTTTITGTGTTFTTTFAVGDCIVIGGVPHKITSITDNNTLDVQGNVTATNATYTKADEIYSDSGGNDNLNASASYTLPANETHTLHVFGHNNLGEGNLWFHTNALEVSGVEFVDAGA